ncbi:MAG: hypothetical protein V4478_01520 [Patescibacteria group bacterium]
MKRTTTVSAAAQRALSYVRQEKGVDHPYIDPANPSFTASFSEYNHFFKKRNRIRISTIPRYTPPRMLLAA